MKQSQVLYSFLVCFFGLSLFSYAQSAKSLQLINNGSGKIVDRIKLKKNYPGEEAIKNELDHVVNLLQNDGYLLASVDSVVAKENIYTAYINPGDKYKWGRLRVRPADKNLVNESGLSEKLYVQTVFKPRTFASVYNKLLTYLENNGYPFASIGFDSVEIGKEEISAVLDIRKNKFIRLDSLIQFGKEIVSYNFLSHYLQIKEGMPYSEKRMLEVSQKLRQLPFLMEKRNPEMRITDKYAKLYLFLDKKNASQFDGILGLLPDANGKTVFTGDLKIKLNNNVFKAGELLELNFRRLQSQTQDISLKTSYPYLFRTPVGTDYGLKIYRKDTTFIDVQNNIGLQYFFSGLNNVKLFYKQRTSNLLSTSGMETLTVLPEYADVSTSSYGLGLTLEKLDYKFNPRKGISINFTSSAGNRKIRKNARLQEEIYEGLKLVSAQYQGEIALNAYLPVGKRSCIRFGTQGAGLYSDKIFRNELIRIGGLKTLRGFDEESIYASSYVIQTLEYRFLFEQNSALLLFAEGAWYENNSVRTYVTDMPYSVGAGINFETKAGIFSLNYALGSQFGNPFDLRSGKIHFGIVNVF
ncbi:MAG TPA: BamA/TamA family outer membrane protein [Bacteroidia bacterium]